MFFHLFGLAILEIIFYFFYIGPFEHNMFINSFSRSMGGLINRVDSTHQNPGFYQNISIFENANYELLNELKDEADMSEKRRIKVNNDLFNTTLEIWFTGLGVLIGIILLYHFIKKLSKRRNDGQDIELINLNQENNQYSQIEIQDNEKNNIWKKILSYIFFAGLVLLFEYIFFQYVVLKYHIITDQQIQYLLYNQFYQFSLNYNDIN